MAPPTSFTHGKETWWTLQYDWRVHSPPSKSDTSALQTRMKAVDVTKRSLYLRHRMCAYNWNIWCTCISKLSIADYAMEVIENLVVTPQWINDWYPPVAANYLWIGTSVRFAGRGVYMCSSTRVWPYSSLRFVCMHSVFRSEFKSSVAE